jgi:hypothetical protein
MLMLVAFALQSYVTQTHIHFDGHAVTGGIAFGGEGSKAAANKISAALHASGNHDKFPPADDPANCPICQEMLYAGHYVMPAAIFVVLPSLPVSTIAVTVETPLRLFAPSHNWRGRAPPRI